jgi:hypothetical protein
MIYGIGSGLNHKKNAFYKERLKTLDDKHRNKHLETQMFEYQIVNNFETVDEADAYRNIIWFILDTYYRELEHTEKETEDIKHWRLCLARMDIRKMKTEITKNDNQTYILFIPELDLNLKEYSDENTKKYTHSIELLPLSTWSYYAYENNDKKFEYKQYENNPQAILHDLRNILDLPKTDYYQSYYRSTPIFVCAILVRYYFNDLSDDDKILCKEIIMEYATLSINADYFFQFGDVVEQAILSLPYTVRYYSDITEDVKYILLFALFKCFTIGNSMKFFFDFAIRAIHILYKNNPNDAKAILYAYIILYPKYKEIVVTM